MRGSIALELAGELSAVLNGSRQTFTRARLSNMPRATVSSVDRSRASGSAPPPPYRLFSSSAVRKWADSANNSSGSNKTSYNSGNNYSRNTGSNGATASKPAIQQTQQTQQPSTSTPAPAPAPAPASSSATPSRPIKSLTDGLSDPPPAPSDDDSQVDWSRSFHGMSSSPFSAEQSAILTAELPADDIEIKPDGIVYLPEIKYRRILNKAFGPGGWGLAPRGETIVTGKLVTREYGLVAGGRLISIARGEQAYFDPDGIPTATEGCKSNALMRCCKDLGVASELWDPRFIRRYLKEYARECIVEHVVTRKRRKHWMRKDDEIKWPFKEVSAPATGAVSPSTVRR